MVKPDLTEKYGKEMDATIKTICTPGKGILAADESTGTIGKRFDQIKLENTETNRQAYRQLLFDVSSEANKYIGGVILYEETLYQKTLDGVLFSKVLTDNGIVPGIKVDLGLVLIPGNKNGEEVAQGLDNLSKRCAEYYRAGARFAKWRGAYRINDTLPSQECIVGNAINLARYAAICQINGLVPIVEPEVLVTEEDQTIERSYEVTEAVLAETFYQLQKHNVNLERIFLKPNMVLPGTKCKKQNTSVEIAEATVKVLRATVPPAVPGIVFLSGGQSEDEAAINLNEINKVKGEKPWYLTYSYGRALQHSAIVAWGGKKENVKAGQDAYLAKSINCSLASQGKLENCL
jgi:fructose-bisphosphate aldolase, class I